MNYQSLVLKKKSSWIFELLNVSKNPRKRERTTLNSTIVKHLLNTGHQVDTFQPFKMIDKQPSSSSLKFTEVISIRHKKTHIFVQKGMVVNLYLPWWQISLNCILGNCFQLLISLNHTIMSFYYNFLVD